MEMLKQQHKIELLERKYQLDEEKYNRINAQPTEAEDVTGKGGTIPPGMVEAGSIDILQLMNDVNSEPDEEIVEDEA